MIISPGILRGEAYKACLKPSSHLVEHMLEYKRHEISLEVARKEAKEVLFHVEQTADAFCAATCDKEDAEMRALLQDVSYNIMKIATLKELT